MAVDKKCSWCGGEIIGGDLKDFCDTECYINYLEQEVRFQIDSNGHYKNEVADLKARIAELESSLHEAITIYPNDGDTVWVPSVQVICPDCEKMKALIKELENLLEFKGRKVYKVSDG